MIHYFLSHGINTDGSGNVDILGAALQRLGHSVVDVPLPERHTWSARKTIQRDADVLAETMAGVNPAYRALIGHSHGCNVALRAAKQARVTSIWLVNPATSSKYDFSGTLCLDKRIFCVYSPEDWVIKLGNLLPFGHPFGAAGYKGFKNLPPENNFRSFGGHGIAFREPILSNWAKKISDTDVDWLNGLT